MERAVLLTYPHFAAAAEPAEEQLFGERFADLLLDQPGERPSAEDFIVTLLG